MKNFKNIKWILKKQIELDSLAKWAWIKKENGNTKEFNCVYEIKQKEPGRLLTASQLLEKLTTES